MLLHKSSEEERAKFGPAHRAADLRKFVFVWEFTVFIYWPVDSRNGNHQPMRDKFKLWEADCSEESFNPEPDKAATVLGQGFQLQDGK